MWVSAINIERYTCVENKWDECEQSHQPPVPLECRVPWATCVPYLHPLYIMKASNLRLPLCSMDCNNVTHTHPRYPTILYQLSLYHERKFDGHPPIWQGQDWQSKYNIITVWGREKINFMVGCNRVNELWGLNTRKRKDCYWEGLEATTPTWQEGRSLYSRLRKEAMIWVT